MHVSLPVFLPMQGDGGGGSDGNGMEGKGNREQGRDELYFKVPVNLFFLLAFLYQCCSEVTNISSIHLEVLLLFHDNLK